MQPPIVQGVTESPEPPLGSMIGKLAQGTAQSDIRAGIASFLKAAQKDPRLADRIRRALDVLEGNQTYGDRTGMGGPSAANGPKIGPSVGDVRTPI